MSKKDQEILDLKEALSRARQQRDMYKNALDSNKVKSIDEMAMALYNSPMHYSSITWRELNEKTKDYWTGELMKIIS